MIFFGVVFFADRLSWRRIPRLPQARAGNGTSTDARESGSCKPKAGIF